MPIAVPHSDNQWIEALLALRSSMLHAVHEVDRVLSALVRGPDAALDHVVPTAHDKSLDAAVEGIHRQALDLLAFLGKAVDRTALGPNPSPKRRKKSSIGDGAGLDEALRSLSRLIDVLNEHRDAIAHRLTLTEAQSELLGRTIADLRADKGPSADAGPSIAATSDLMAAGEATIAALVHDLRLVDAMAASARLDVERGVLIHAALELPVLDDADGYLFHALDLHRQGLLSARDIESRRQKAADLLSALAAARSSGLRREDVPSS